MYISRFITLSILILTLSAPDSAAQHEHHHDHGAGYAPAGVMGGHMHEAGEWMFSYRYMTMLMQDNREGTSQLETSQVTRDFMVAPTKMRMDMHMLGAMWAPSSRVTLMLMLPYLYKVMDHVNRAGVTFTTTSRGPGDISATPMILLFDRGGHRIHLGAGVSLPTGRIDERAATPVGPDQKLPYPMQLGSGTFDLLAGLTYSGQVNWWSWGLQPSAVVRLGRNKHDYRLSNTLKTTAWISRKLDEPLSLSLRASWEEWGDIKGHDTELNRAMVATAEPLLRAGERLDVALGFDLNGPAGSKMAGHRLAFEVGLPAYQYLDGPQLETDLTLSTGWQYSF